MSEEQKVVKRKSPITFLVTATVFLILGGAIAGGVVYQLAKTNPEVLGIAATVVITEEEENKKLLTQMSQIIDLPTDEMPTIVSISNQKNEKPDTFFTNAKDGDKVVYFTKNKRAILYRPTENKIIDIGFISATPAPSPIATLSPVLKSMRFFIFNGTSALGATKGIETKLKELYPNAEILGRMAANKTTYVDTVLIDLLGSRTEEAKKFADELGITVGVLPGDEKGPDNSDFLIIVGKSSIVTATSSATPAQ